MFTGTTGHALYTSSWVAAKGDVHSQQRWFYMGHKGEVSVDQARRGYSMATDAAGFATINPLFWKPTKNAITGEFSGQRCYGYISCEAFVDAASACTAGRATPADFDGALPTLATTAGATAILEAGRRSLDAGGRPFELVYSDESSEQPIDIRPAVF
jgi:D-galacturonate reductase